MAPIRLRSFLLVLGAALMCAPLPLLADAVVGLGEARAATVARLLKPGDILIWNCPTCSGVTVMSVKRVRVSKWGNSPEFAVMVERDVLISSRRTIESLAGMPCTGSGRQDPDDETEGWPLDVTYTYAASGGDRTFVSIGRAVGVTNNPVPTISISAEALANVRRCADKRKRTADAFDRDGDPLLERLIARDEGVRSAALRSLKDAVRSMSAPARQQLVVELIEQAGDVGTLEGGPGNGERAQRALAELGPVAAPSLLRVVLDRNEDVVLRDVCARLVGGIRPVAPETVSGLVDALNEERRSPPRGGVAFGLGETGVASERVLDALRRGLLYRYSNVPGGVDLNSYAEIALALEKLGARPPDARPVLAGFLEQQNAYERVQAAVALLVLDPGGRKAPAVLIEILEDRNLSGPVHRALLASVGRAGPAAKDLVSAMARILNDKERAVDRAALLSALEGIGTKEARDAVGRYRRENPGG